jgi:hypothetical protein
MPPSSGPTSTRPDVGGMLLPAVLVLAGVAVAAWLFALVALVQIVGMAPAGQRMSTLFNLGWLRLGRVTAAAGPASAPYARTYFIAMLTFLVVVILIAAVAVLAAAPGQSGSGPDEQTAEPRRITDPRVITVRTASDGNILGMHQNDPNVA